MNNDPLIVLWLEQQAKANAGVASTGVARDGDISVLLSGQRSLRMAKPERPHHQAVGDRSC
jgi:hypothetical protein